MGGVKRLTTFLVEAKGPRVAQSLLELILRYPHFTTPHKLQVTLIF